MARAGVRSAWGSDVRMYACTMGPRVSLTRNVWSCAYECMHECHHGNTYHPRMRPVWAPSGPDLGLFDSWMFAARTVSSLRRDWQAGLPLAAFIARCYS